MTEYHIFTAPRRSARHWKAATVTWDDVLRWAENPASQRESGGYVFGQLKATTVTHTDPNTGKQTECNGYHRLKQAVVSRSALTLDIDHATPTTLPRLLVDLVGELGLVHTTYNSTADEPRYRLILPTDRDMTPEEYMRASLVLMHQLGFQLFDPGSSQPERFMYKPASAHMEWYDYHVLEGERLSVDELLEQWSEDLRPEPVKPSRTKRDPFELQGATGAFNRAYQDLDLLIETYELPYAPVDANRWMLIGADSAPGMLPVGDGLWYSHHANDPARGRAHSAFDLVRVHRFGHLDHDSDEDTPVNRLPSHKAMLDVAATDARVVADLVGMDFDASVDDVLAGDGWKLQLTFAPRTGQMKDEVGNWDLIFKHDPVFQLLRYNEMTYTVEANGDLPWRDIEPNGPVFTAGDRSQLAFYIEREYKYRPSRTLVDDLIAAVVLNRRFHPVREYLETLHWDGVSRVETCLPGVTPTTYTRVVARKSLVAAVARVFEPGIKWDHTLVLYGREGLGKSWWVHRLAKGWTASLGRIGDKDTLLTMQRSWIVVADEAHSLRKADADAQKEFLTRTEDVFRLPYERETQAHPRHCVIWSTTNDDVFLRRQEGNRRFLIVHCEAEVDFSQLTDEYIDQLWAEAVHLYREGERLYLDTTERELAADVREAHTEEDTLGGLIQEYVDRLVPEGWDDMSVEARLRWMEEREQGFVEPGTRRQEVLCSIQVWVEVLRQPVGTHKRSDLLDISAAIKRLPGWTTDSRRPYLPQYGRQVVYRRIDDYEELI